jgi:hypothetical protein
MLERESDGATPDRTRLRLLPVGACLVGCFSASLSGSLPALIQWGARGPIIRKAGA